MKILYYTLIPVVIVWLILLGLYLYVLNKLAYTTYFAVINQALTITLILSITWLSIQLIRKLFQKYTKKAKTDFMRSTLFSNTAVILVSIISGLIILQTLNISITPLLTALGVGGLAVALALQDTLSNLFSGIQILVSKQIRPGDFIELSSGEKGHVADISWRNTTINELPNNVIIIPNAKLATAVLKNYSLPEQSVIFGVELCASYDNDLVKLETITLALANEIQNKFDKTKPDFQPNLKFQSFKETNINFCVVFKASEFANQFLIKHEFLKALPTIYKSEGIKMPNPIYIKTEK